MTLRQKIEQELAEINTKLARGKGTWPEPSYVRDETWAGWIAERSTLESLLRHQDPTPTYDDLMQFVADFTTKFDTSTSYDREDGVFRRHGMWRCDGSYSVPSDKVFAEAVAALERYHPYPFG